MTAPHHEFGDTCPLLKIARKYEVDYAVTLVIADSDQHCRNVPAGVLPELDPQVERALCNDVYAVGERMRYLRAGYTP